jgi:protein-disulfide isomerase
VEGAAEKRYTWAALRYASDIACLFLSAVAIAGAVACRDSNASNAAATSDSASAETKEVKDVVLPAIDISAMTPRERHQWSTAVTEALSPCANVPVSVAQCIQESRPCGSCIIAAKWLAHAVREGASPDAIRHAYKERFDPSSAKTIPIDGSPTRGPDDAPVTIVEFADFECPHCRDAVPRIDAVLEAHPTKARLVYKTYTLPFHTRGEPAARAAFAAEKQGKFWEMEHQLFEHQQHLEDADLERYARALRLDIPRWKADVDSTEVTDRVAHDRKLGEELKLRGTPTIYVNGRELDTEADESLEGRLASELGVPATPETAASGAEHADHAEHPQSAPPAPSGALSTAPKGR